MANPEHLELLRQDVDGWNAWREKEPSVTPVLAGADLSGATLFGANLNGADLISANLSGANLTGANFGEAYLSEANLRAANLSGANLRGAKLSSTDLREANLRGANLSGIDLREANLSGTDLRGANLRGANLRGTDLREANFGKADLRAANLSQTNLMRAHLSGADLTGADLRRANLCKANLSGADLRSANLSEAILNEATLTRAALIKADIDRAHLIAAYLAGARLGNARLRAANLEAAQLMNADFSRADLTEAILRQADLTRLPRHHRAEVGDRIEERAHIVHDDPALVAVDGQTLHCRRLARPQSADMSLLDRGGVGREQGGYRVLARATAGDDPKLADALRRGRSAAGQLAEGDDLLRSHRQSKSGLEDGAPRIPTVAFKPRAETLSVAHRIDDAGQGAPPLTAGAYRAVRRSCRLEGVEAGNASLASRKDSSRRAIKLLTLTRSLRARASPATTAACVCSKV
jgi:uncharacterized protein YjbI with pentapeptide repeats